MANIFDRLMDFLLDVADVFSEATCGDCGEKKSDVEERINPFVSDVYGRTEYIEVCDDCWRRRREDV